MVYPCKHEEWCSTCTFYSCHRNKCPAESDDAMEITKTVEESKLMREKRYNKEKKLKHRI